MKRTYTLFTTPRVTRGYLKKIGYFLLSLLFLTANSSCLDDWIDVVPDNVATIDHAFRDKTRAEQYLATCYSYLPKSGRHHNPGFFDDFTCIGAEHYLYQEYSVSYKFFGYRTFKDGNKADDPLMNFWQGRRGGVNLFQGIRDCNIFLERIDEPVDLERYEKNRWGAEVKFLKAYYHFLLLQMYGPIPIVKENLPISAGPEEVAVFREPVEDVFDYIVQLIDEAVPDLPLTIDNEISEMGRITQPIALAIKAKVLVTAASPLFNGNKDCQSLVDKRGVQLFNPVEDPGKWKRAATACKNAIDTCLLAGHDLYHFISTKNMSEATRQICQVSQIVADKWNPEHIWGMCRDDPTTDNLPDYDILPRFHHDHLYSAGLVAPTMKAVEYFYSKNGVPINEDIYYDYDTRFDITNTRPEESPYVQPYVTTAKLHLNREPRFYGSIGFDKGWWYGLGRYNEDNQWPINAKNGEISGPKGTYMFSMTGFFIKKRSNFHAVYNQTSYIDKPFDFPVIRLADLYLLYAEALNETKDMPDNEVYEYVDLVRERAGLKGVVESWSNYSKISDKYRSKEGMRAIIQQERGIELAFEEQRFWDLRRWGLAPQEFNGYVRGWYFLGETDAEFYKVSNYHNIKYSTYDIFWPIPKSELRVNHNLIQNLGW